MKLALLTTPAAIRAYYAQKICSVFPISLIIIETKPLTPSFAVRHPFEDEQEIFEKESFFKDNYLPISDFPQALLVKNINDNHAVRALKQLSPDATIIFGTGKLKSNTLSACNNAVNLHRGDPQAYRGLDSHLWQIYHNDFSPFITTIHKANDLIDDGEIILQQKMEIRKEMKISHLRKYYTEICVELSLAALEMYAQKGSFSSKPQRSVGRYYSFMPAVLKEVCVNKFTRYVGSLA